MRRKEICAGRSRLILWADAWMNFDVFTDG